MIEKRKRKELKIEGGGKNEESKIVMRIVERGKLMSIKESELESENIIIEEMLRSSNRRIGKKDEISIILGDEMK